MKSMITEQLGLYGWEKLELVILAALATEMPYLIDAYQVDRFGTRLNFDEKSFPARDWFSIECINRDNDFRHKQRIIDYY